MATVTISQEEYDRLRKCEDELNTILDTAGVSRTSNLIEILDELNDRCDEDEKEIL